MLHLNFGPRAQHVYQTLRDAIVRGELVAEARLPSHIELAREFGIAPMTVRQALARLQEEGLVSREQGRGTFVRARDIPTVLIVDDDDMSRAVLRSLVSAAGARPVEAAGPSEALEAMESERNLALLFTDVHMPDSEAGIRFIRMVRRRWPTLPLVAVTAYAEDLTHLHATPQCPVLILAKPVRRHLVNETLRLALGLPRQAPAGMNAGSPPPAKAEESPQQRAREKGRHGTRHVSPSSPGENKAARVWKGSATRAGDRTSNGAKSEQVLDWTELAERTGENTQLMFEMVRLFLNSYPARVSTIRDAVTRRDPQALKETAHLLKGSLALLGARAAYEATRRLEDMGRSRDMSAAPGAIANLQKEIRRLEKSLAAIQQETA